jgi:DNA (cytosine-5)-methyltransferase 1
MRVLAPDDTDEPGQAISGPGAEGEDMPEIATFATLFAGGGLADIGMRQAGLGPLWAVEYDAAIADVYRANHGDHVIVDDVRRVTFDALPAPDLLWLSPPCPSFSVAKADGGETVTDLEIADACARAIATLKPRAVILENVRGYATSQSFARIRAALDALDYWSSASVINSADVGTPQTRERLIMRAVIGGWMQADRPWPAPVRWRGWYEAIEDLIPTLPPSQFADWQIKRLPEEIKGHLLVSNLRHTITPKATVRKMSDPATTVIASSMDRPNWTDRAFIVDGTPNGNGERITVRPADSSMFTVISWARAAGGSRAWLGTGRVVALTPRALARFQGVPDTYALPDRKALACRIIGNGVAVDVARVATETLCLK